MRVALISREYPPCVGGGIGTYTATLARALAQAGHRVSVVTREAPGSNADADAEVEGLRVHRVRFAPDARREGPRAEAMSFLDVYRYGHAVASAIDRIIAGDGLDVIQSPEHGAEGVVLGAGRVRVPHVVRFHTPLFLVNEAVGRRLSPGGRIVHMLERRAARRAVLNTCASRALAGVVAARFRIPPDRIRIVPNAVDHERYTPAPRDGVRPLTVLYVGKVAPLKGAGDLAEAIPRILQRVPEARVVLVGSDHPGERTGSTRAEMLAALQKAGAASRVTFLAPMPRPELVRVYQAADVCVLPTLWDNFPNTCLEAMACGVPVVATAVGGLPEIIRDGHDGILVPPHDPARIAEATAGLLLDAMQRHAMGDAARRRVLTAYTMGAVANQTVAVYEDARRRFAEQGGARATDERASATS